LNSAPTPSSAINFLWRDGNTEVERWREVEREAARERESERERERASERERERERERGTIHTEHTTHTSAPTVAGEASKRHRHNKARTVRSRPCL